MRRRTFFAIVSSPLLLADTEREILDLLESMASGLSQEDPEAFVRALDPAMPGYQTVSANVRALVAQMNVLAAIEILTQRGDAQHQDVQLDWFLELTLKGDPMSLTRRREMVKCRMEKQKKKWRVVSMEPLGLFEPPKPRQ